MGFAMFDLTDEHDPVPDCDCQACAIASRDKLRTEAETFQMAYRMKCDVETKALTQQVKVLRDALSEAAHDIEQWGSYTSDYLIKKWDLEGDVARARAALEKTA